MKIALKSWRSELDARVPDGVNTFFRSYLYFARRRAFNRHTLWLGLGLATLLSGIFGEGHRREAWVLFLSLAAFSLYLYLRAAKLAAAVRISWLNPGDGAAFERDRREVRFSIENTSAFSGSEVWVTDTFPASAEAKVRFRLADELPAFGRVTASYRRPLDAGMGEFELGPLSLVVGDPLGLFEFVVSEEERPRRLRVLPRAEAVDGIPIRGSRESFQFGVHDVPVHGSSVSFMGVREYARGDSLRQISWRLSARSSRLLVKDFEKAVNADVTLLLNMCAREHMGSKSRSTWEYAKDAALGILMEQISEGNAVQLLSNGVAIPFGRGAEHVEYITAQIFRAGPAAAPPHESARLLLDFSPLIPSSSTLIYVAPFFGKDTSEVVTRLLTLKERNIEIICLAIEASTFMHDQAHGTLRAYLEAELARAGSMLEKESERLAAAGIPVYWIECDRPIASSLLAPTRRKRGGAPGALKR